MNGHDESIPGLIQQLSTLNKFDPGFGEFHKRLSIQINELVDKDFGALIQLLYRLDIDEYKLRSTLADNPCNNAGEIIADLIIERQLQKIKSRQEFKTRDDIDEDEKW